MFIDAMISSSPAIRAGGQSFLLWIFNVTPRRTNKEPQPRQQQRKAFVNDAKKGSMTNGWVILLQSLLKVAKELRYSYDSSCERIIAKEAVGRI